MIVAKYSLSDKGLETNKPKYQFRVCQGSEVGGRTMETVIVIPHNTFTVRYDTQAVFRRPHKSVVSPGGFVDSNLGHNLDHAPKDQRAAAAAYHAIESVVLGHAIASVKVYSPQYKVGLERAIWLVEKRLI
jgi:hypothetical protein